MRKFLRRLKKGFKTACLTTALVTCWSIGQTANAAPDPPPELGDEVTIHFSGTVSPTVNNISHLFLIYGTGYSAWENDYYVRIGDFPAGQNTPFSVFAPGTYCEQFSWFAAGLYGDISSGQYIQGVNGVTLGVLASDGQSWRLSVDEETAFTALLNDNPDILYSDLYHYLYSHDHFYDFNDLYITDSSVLFDFTTASNNGQIQLQTEIVPEPISIVLFGGGSIIVMASRRRKD